MAMTKKELQHLEFVTNERDLHKSMLYATLGIIEVHRDLLITDCDEILQGWDFNAYTKHVYPAWSSSIYHGDGEYNPKGRASQNPRELFSTKEKASQAMFNEIKLKHAKELAETMEKIK